MRRTALACAVCVLLAYGAARALTHDFQVWTAEGARRLDVALQPVAAPRIAMIGPGLAEQTLERLLTRERAVSIVAFVYTRCLSVCSVLGSTFEQLQRAIAATDRPEGAAPLRLLSISFDAAHDDAAALARYAARLHADARLWRFARVADVADAPVLLARYQVTVIPDGLGGYEHNAALLVVDPAGRLVRVFDEAEAENALAYARFIAEKGASP